MPELSSMIASVAAKWNIPPNIFAGLVSQESGGNVNVPRGAAGEVGLTQIKPSTAGMTAEQLSDPLTNLNAGAAYLAQNYKAFGNWSDALRGYNAGTAGAAANPTLSAGYASSVLGKAGITGTAPGTQPAGATGGNSSVGTPTSANPSGSPAAPSSSLATGVKYGLAIFLVVILVVVGVAATVKG